MPARAVAVVAFVYLLASVAGAGEEEDFLQILGDSSRRAHILAHQVEVRSEASVREVQDGLEALLGGLAPEVKDKALRHASSWKEVEPDFATWRDDLRIRGTVACAEILVFHPWSLKSDPEECGVRLLQVQVTREHGYRDVIRWNEEALLRDEIVPERVPFFRYAAHRFPGFRDLAPTSIWFGFDACPDTISSEDPAEQLVEAMLKTRSIESVEETPLAAREWKGPGDECYLCEIPVTANTVKWRAHIALEAGFRQGDWIVTIRVSRGRPPKVDLDSDAELAAAIEDLRARTKANRGEVDALAARLSKGLQSLEGKLVTIETPFSRQVRMEFSAWDLDHDAYLCEAEIDKAMKDASVRGVAAAGLATLKSYRESLQALDNSEWGPENSGVTAMDLEAHETTGEPEGIPAGFNENLRRILTTSRALFPSAPDPLAIRQGSVGDCSFLAAVCALARQRPADVRALVRGPSGGLYLVSLPSRPPLTVEGPTDAEIAYFSDAGANGLWLTVLEKGIGKTINEDSWFWKKELPQEATDGGAALAEGIHLITGKTVDVDDLGLTRQSTTREKLRDTLTSSRIVTAGIYSSSEEEDGLRGGFPVGHAYTILAFDEPADMVKVRNPWGKGEPFDENGKALDGKEDGIFDLTLEEFHLIFSTVAYEQGD